MFKRLLGLDQLYWAFLFIGLVVAGADFHALVPRTHRLGRLGAG